MERHHEALASIVAGHSQRQLGAEWGVSHERIRQLVNHAHARLERHLAAEGPCLACHPPVKVKLTPAQQRAAKRDRMRARMDERARLRAAGLRASFPPGTPPDEVEAEVQRMVGLGFEVVQRSVLPHSGATCVEFQDAGKLVGSGGRLVDPPPLAAGAVLVDEVAS